MKGLIVSYLVSHWMAECWTSHRSLSVMGRKEPVTSSVGEFLPVVPVPSKIA